MSSYSNINSSEERNPLRMSKVGELAIKPALPKACFLPSTKNLHAGFSLVELMIALLIGSFILVAMIQIFGSSKSAYVSMMSQARAQDTGRAAAELVAKQIRRAGLRQQADQLPSEVFVSGLEHVAGFDDVDDGSVTVQSVAINGVIEGTDVLVIRYQKAASSQQEDEFLDCIGQQLGGFNETDEDGNTQRIDFAEDSFFVDVYYLRESTEGSPHLYCRGLRADASGALLERSGVSSGQVALDVIDFQVEFGVDENRDGSPDYFTAPETAGLDLSAVIAVRSNIIVQGGAPADSQSDDAASRAAYATAIRREFSQVVALRNVLP